MIPAITSRLKRTLNPLCNSERSSPSRHLNLRLACYRLTRVFPQAGPAWSRWFFILVLLQLTVFYNIQTARCEGTKELNQNSFSSTRIYICNDFSAHCTSGYGVRSNFAAYDNTQSAADEERLYFVTQNADEVVYMGFNAGDVPASCHIVYRIKNIAGTVVQAEQPLPTSGAGFISAFSQAVNGPNQLPSPVITTGYNALIFTPSIPGTYYIEFSLRYNSSSSIYIGDFDIEFIDITVGNTSTHTAKPGRVYSKCWQFYETNGFYSKNYVFSNDNIVTSAQFTNINGGHWIQYCNQTGCGNSSANWITNRKSLNNQQALFPQYKIFLNLPDPFIFPPATTLGQIVPPMPYGVQNCSTGHILFHVNVNKAGNAEITLTFPPPYQSRTLNLAVVVGDNIFDWDGLDGTYPTPLIVPNNTTIQFTVDYINGLTNLPLYDVEGNSSGMTIALVSPTGTAPGVYWDDSNIGGGTTNLNPPGCLSTSGCHPWSYGDKNTINTWWYNVSTTTATSTIIEFRGSPALTINQTPPQSFCPNSGGHLFSVTPNSNTSEYHWSYNPPAGVTLSQTSPSSPTVTVNFGSTAASGVLMVYGTNTNCTSAGPSSSLPITILPTAVPAISGPGQVCAGSAATYTTASGNTNYQWTVSPGGTITSGGTSASNFVAVNWNSSGPRSVSVNYTPGAGFCSTATATVYPVTVNPLPVPPLSGPTPVCVGTSGHTYTTSAGKTNYIWQLSGGGTITSGGTSTSNSAVITWNSVGNHTLSVKYTDPSTGCIAASPTVLTITVSNLPNPTFISGPSSVCLNTPGNVYTTQPGMSNYLWNVNGGTITAGGNSTSNSATITWTSAGNRSVSVNYTFPSSTCTAPAPTVMTVTVKPLPSPSIVSGPNSACQGVPGNTYTTQPGMANYVWIASGGSITSGGGTNSVTVTWTNPGNRSLSVNYTDPVTQCQGATPGQLAVTVNSQAVPSFISGALAVCQGASGEVYATQPNMINYQWNISGGTITSGGTSTSNSVTMSWDNPGNYTIMVSYTDPSTSCSAAAPALRAITVNPVPVPDITGPLTPCLNATGLQYHTEAGMSGYLWTVGGGSFTPGTSPDFINVTWLGTGLHTITVTYTATNGCNPLSPGQLGVIVKTIPDPTITGSPAMCTGIQTTYTTEVNMTNYLWSVSPGGTVISGGTTASSDISINWTSPGTKQVSVNYDAGNGCMAGTPKVYTVVVSQSPSPSVNQITPGYICQLSTTTFATQPGMTAYNWSVSTGGVIWSAPGQNEITVRWTDTGTQWLQVNYTDQGCQGLIPGQITVTVNDLPVTTITPGPGPDCASLQRLYQAPAKSGCTFTWAVVPSGIGTVAAGQGSNSVLIDWSAPGPAVIGVTGTMNTTGCSSASDYPTTVYPNVMPSFTPCFDQVTTPLARKIILRGASPFIAGQGVYSGPRVLLNSATGMFEFDPSGAAAGVYSITYSFTNSYGCTAVPPAAAITVQKTSFYCGNDLTDVRDGRRYHTAWFDKACWMTENLNYGNQTDAAKPSSDNCEVEKYCQDQDAGCLNNGGLYQWDEIMQYGMTYGNQGICPPGWHVPSESEWSALLLVIGNPINPPDGVSGSFLKDPYATDGFHALLNGVRYMNRIWSLESGQVTGALFWSSSLLDDQHALARGVNIWNYSVSRYKSLINNAFYVRCVLD